MRVVVLFFVIPILIGEVINLSLDERPRSFVYLEKYVVGWVLMLAIYWPISLIWLFINGRLKYLTILWISIIGGLALWGMFALRRRLKKSGIIKFRIEKKCLIAIVLVLLQIILSSLNGYTNADDATYINQTVSVLKSGLVSLYQQEGTEVGILFMPQYFMSQWSTMGASFAQITGVHPTILLHLILPVFLILLAYAVYYILGFELLKDDDKAVVFVMVMSLLNIFGMYTGYSPSCFLLWRIWQGKAILYTILLPLYICWTIRFQREWTNKLLFMLLVNIVAAIHVTEISVVMIGILWGVFVMTEFIPTIKEAGMYGSLVKLKKQGVLLIPIIIVGIIYLFMMWSIM